MNDIIFNCPLCNKSLTVEAKGAGLKVPCPECGKEITIPKPKTDRDSGNTENEICVDENVKITTARIIIGNTTYALRNITSVKSTMTPPDTGAATGFLFVSILGLIGGGAWFYKCRAEAMMPALIIAGTSIIFIVISSIWLRGLKDSYNVMITSTAGEMKALTSI